MSLGGCVLALQVLDGGVNIYRDLSLLRQAREHFLPGLKGWEEDEEEESLGGCVLVLYMLAGGTYCILRVVGRHLTGVVGGDAFAAAENRSRAEDIMMVVCFSMVIRIWVGFGGWLSIRWRAVVRSKCREEKGFRAVC